MRKSRIEIGKYNRSGADGTCDDMESNDVCAFVEDGCCDVS